MSPESAPRLTTVIVPYFQREPGLLRRCAESVLAQQGAGAVHLIVVDDASPVSAAEELAGLWPENPAVQVIRQDNAGPGAARNKGLDHVPPGTTYVGFIDSDDWWEPDMLQHATRALDLGHDIFFANSRRHGFAEARFDWHAAAGRQLIAREHTPIDPEYELYAYAGSFFDYALVRSNVISTSALVYRLDRFPGQRFNTRLFNGQDRLFKLHLSRQSERVAFCPRVLVNEGTGINIYDSAKWGNAKSLRLLSNYIQLSKAILAELPLSALQRDIVVGQLNDSRFSLTASLLHLLKAGQQPDWKLVWRTLRKDPALLWQFVPNLARIVRKRAVRPQS